MQGSCSTIPLENSLLLVLGWTSYKGNLTNSEDCKKQFISCIFSLIPAQGIFLVWTSRETYQEKDRTVLGSGWGGFTAFKGDISVLGGKPIAASAKQVFSV